MLRFIPLLLLPSFLYAQQLTVEQIMQDPKWIGSSPSSPVWSVNGKELYFNWNPDRSPADSLYVITSTNAVPRKVTQRERQQLVTSSNVVYNTARTMYLHSREGDIFLTEIARNHTKRITQTMDIESSPRFSFNDSRVIYNRNQNLYAWDLRSGETVQLTNIRSGTAPAAGTKKGSTQEEWLKADQLATFDVLRTRKEKREAGEKASAEAKTKSLKPVYIDDQVLQSLQISPDGRIVTYILSKPAASPKTTIVADYVTESGFTTPVTTRTKVGSAGGTASFFIYDLDRDTTYQVKTDSIEGIRDLPDYLADYPGAQKKAVEAKAARKLSFLSPSWSPDSKYLVLDVRADDNKDRWLILLDTATRALKVINRQHDNAWIGGPGIFSTPGWINNHTLWYQSEKTGYSHLYTYNLLTGEESALTSGNFEVVRSQLSTDKKYFYITTNEVHPGEQHFYRMNISTGIREQLTTMPGSNQVSLSPDEKKMAVLHSFITQPWELYLQDARRKALPSRITQMSRSDSFNRYAWREPEVITIPARDGQPIYARVYKPRTPKPGAPAVLFVHGAGYLQNAHKWWSSYFREYMFNNLLADKGYYVLDIDYRGSAGYGRKWRTGIYRHMGGSDLTDHVDAVRYLVRTHAIDSTKVGIYGGSYGGFISLMAMFTEPNVFAAGAALRPVTDWANYNHPYTSNILNEPFNDSLAYRRSSPIYHADGLKGHLLICHGMMDINVHYQDAVKLSQRLIELGKDNWELASYPMEDHAFVEPSSWTDEYKRILKLFETVLK